MSGENHQLLIYHPDSKIYGEILEKRLPELKIHSARTPEEAYDSIEEVEIIFSSKIPDDLLKRAKKLIWLSSTAAGTETLVKNHHLPETVIFTKMNVYGEMMAEYVFAYLLYSIRQGSKHLEDQQKRVWDPVKPDRLRGRVLGILGLGSIGREIARHGKAFGMRVIGVKRTVERVENVDQVFAVGDLERMISLVDYLIVVLPYTPETYHLLGEKELSRLKEGGILFNIGRGKTIDEEALIRVLKERKISAVLDVFETEPLPRESELWRLENVTVTPHVSGINIPEEVCEGFAANYERWIRGEPLVGLVDRQKGY